MGSVDWVIRLLESPLAVVAAALGVAAVGLILYAIILMVRAWLEVKPSWSYWITR